MPGTIYFCSFMPSSIAAHQMVASSGRASFTTSMPSGAAITQHTWIAFGLPACKIASMAAAILPPVANIGSTINRVLPLTLGVAIYSAWIPTSVCSRFRYMRKADTKALSAPSKTFKNPWWNGRPARNTVATTISSCFVKGMSIVPKGVFTVLGLYSKVLETS